MEEFVGNEIGFGAAVGVGFQEVGEEENLQNGEDDEELYQNNSPQSFAQFHLAETVGIQMVRLFAKLCEPHKC